MKKEAQAILTSMAKIRSALQDAKREKRPGDLAATWVVEDVSRAGESLRELSDIAPLYGAVGDMLIELHDLMIKMIEDHEEYKERMGEPGVQTAVPESNVPSPQMAAPFGDDAAEDR